MEVYALHQAIGLVVFFVRKMKRGTKGKANQNFSHSTKFKNMMDENKAKIFKKIMRVGGFSGRYQKKQTEIQKQTLRSSSHAKDMNQKQKAKNESLPNLQQRQQRAELEELHRKICSTDSLSDLQRVAETIVTTGNYEITDDKILLFDLANQDSDQATMRLLQQVFATEPLKELPS
ncbi:hypothetical protein Bhyg_08108 [Pseudolycoriella hygida]|uniref:AF-9 ANC1 homology domain-containing protein n=1 Tax=Pseudolycoriella hygida TaxID=35572 RepID=A0A9Q0S2N3_9DIPT|nr:hypothetical protein Bhyg_08108 [Pseudolycoriella hygida]